MLGPPIGPANGWVPVASRSLLVEIPPWVTAASAWAQFDYNEVRETDHRRSMVIEAGGNHARERKIEMRKAAGLPTAFAIGVLSLLPGGRCAWSQPHLPLQYQGGPILKSFKIYPLYYGDWSAADINFQQAFLTNLTAYISGAYAPAGEQPMLMQYGVNTATVAAAATADPTAAPKTLSRSDVINIIHTNQAAGKLPAYGPNTVIFVFPAHGFDVSTGTPPTPCHGCGYHSSESPSELWAVVPADSGPTLQLVTAHEVFESATDSTVDSPPRGWVSLDGSEAVDGCNDPIPAYPFINLSLGPVAIQIPGAADNTQDGICSTTGYTLTPPVGVRTAPAGASPGEGSGFSQTMTFTFTDPRPSRLARSRCRECPDQQFPRRPQCLLCGVQPQRGSALPGAGCGRRVVAGADAGWIREHGQQPVYGERHGIVRCRQRRHLDVDGEPEFQRGLCGRQGGVSGGPRPGGRQLRVAGAGHLEHTRSQPHRTRRGWTRRGWGYSGAQQRLGRRHVHFHLYRHQRLAGSGYSQRADQRLPERQSGLLPGLQPGLQYAVPGERRGHRPATRPDLERRGQREQQSVHGDRRGIVGERERQHADANAESELPPGLRRQSRDLRRGTQQRRCTQFRLAGGGIADGAVSLDQPLQAGRR
ncbi:hypothetical protein SBA4_7130001 [Candidatus Sulfopaludibacter sp. SbA4]|nr:hypothetical protein SBA4_7130001 [Candidatus Sulfopaludibacter sp. SbA4]